MKILESVLKAGALRILAFLFSPPKLSSTDLDLKKIKRILIIRQHDQMGDLLLTTPALRALRNKFPNAFIAMVVREYTYPVIKRNPNLNKIIIFREKFGRWNIKYAFSFWKEIRENYDCAILLNTVSRSVSSDFIALFSKSKIILGPNIPELRTAKKELIYNLLSERKQKPIHQIYRNLETFKPLGVKMDGFEYDLNLNYEELSEGKNIFKNLIPKKNKKIIGIHIGTLDVTRRLPLKTLAVAINQFQSNFTFVLIISKNEVKLKNELLNLLSNKILVAPIMPLRIFAAFIKNLDLFLCNDTGTLHIASSQRVPTLSFHAKNPPQEWKPLNKRHKAIRAKDHLITSITSNQVVLGIESFFKK